MNEIQEREIKKITIEFDNGETATVNKGFIMNMSEDEIGQTLDCNFYMVHISGKEMPNMIYALAQFVSRFMGDTEE